MAQPPKNIPTQAPGIATNPKPEFLH